MTKTHDRFDREEFQHYIHIGEHGETLFDAPVEITNQSDLDNYGIRWGDTRTIQFGRSERIRVYFYRTDNRSFADDQWRYLSTKHSSEYAATRCMVPGIRKTYVKCSDRHSCANCPYGRTPETKQTPLISLDSLTESGYEPYYDSDEQRTLNRHEYTSIRERMDAIDPRIACAFELKELCGYSVKEIARTLGVSEPRVYQLIQRAKQIGAEYLKENEHEVY